MAAANTDKFKRLARRWVGSIGAGGVADGTVTTIPLSSSSGLPTDTAVVATIDRVDANGVATPSLEESVVGVVSGDNLVTCTRGVEGTAQAHSAGAVVEILFTNKVWGDLIDGILAEHSQAGAHTTDTISEKTSAAGVTVDGLKLKDGRVVGWDGWMPAEETWTYASATTITVPSGAASKYSKGDKIRLKQGENYKYFYVVSVADTVLTVTGGSDYSVANLNITDNYYSKVENPQGFPTYFSFTPVFSGTSGSAGSYALQYANVKFAIRGNTCHMYGTARIANKGSWGGQVKVTMPVAGISLDTGCVNTCGGFLSIYNSNTLGIRGFLNMDSGAASGTFTSAWDAALLDWSVVTNNDRLIFTGGGYLF